jgi:hypothetical protein
MPVRSARLVPFAVVCFLALANTPAQAGTADAPEVVDAEGDADLPPLDIAAVWFESNETDLVIHIERGPESATPPAIVQCQEGACVGAGVALRVVFTVIRPDGTPAPALDGYESSYVLVRVGPEDPAVAAVLGYYTDSNPNAVQAANVTINGTSIDVAVPRSSEAIAIPAGATPGAYRITTPFGLSYLMACAPSAEVGCLNQGPLNDQVASAWDRAPDTGFGTDYVFAAPSPAEPTQADTATGGSTVTSTTTVTTMQTETRTMTVEHEVTVTSTPFPVHVEAKGAAGPGFVLALAILGGIAWIRPRPPRQ